ncbi:12204_t:CDS:2 [Funneliformis geosporum]|nr:12204_t:CDS:2 [Funneliformis geosporum]
MAFPQMKKRFSLFGSPPLTPTILSNTSSLLTTPQEICDDNKPTSDEIRKSFENLEKLVLAADEYRDCVSKLSKISRNFSKCLKDYSNGKGIDKSYVQAKLNKALQKEFEILQRFWDKYSKKVAVYEKAHDDHVGDLDKQIKKISKDYEKKSKKDNKASHEKYVASLTSIGSDVARVRTDYAEEVTRREKHTHSVISQIFCRFTEGQFASFNESLKKCEPSITKVKEWTPFAGQDIPLPLDLDGFLEMQTMTLPESDDNNHNNEPITSKKLPRRPSYRISQYIASISEMQKVAMKHKTSPPLTEVPKDIKKEESLFFKSQTPTVSSIESNPAPVITENETITSTLKSKEKLSNDNHLTPNLLSSLSIGIHDDDNPFLRDGSKMIIETGEKVNSIIMTKVENDQERYVNNYEREDSPNLEENHVISLSPIYDKNIPLQGTAKSNDKMILFKNDQLKTEKNINDSNFDNENEISKPIDKYYTNEYQVTERMTNESPAPSFDTERLVRSFPIDLPARSQPSTPSNSPREKSSVCYNMKMDHYLSGYNRDLNSIITMNTDHQGTHPYQHSDSSQYREDTNHDSRVSSPTTHLAKSYIDRSPQRQYNIQPRRAYTEYSSTDNDKKCGTLVADIRERLLSLNVNERSSTTTSPRDFPKPRQGYVNEVKTRFVGMRESNNNDTPPYSPINSGSDDMYPDQVENSEVTITTSPSNSILNEQCEYSILYDLQLQILKDL